MQLTLDKIKTKKTSETPCSTVLSVKIPSEILMAKQEETLASFQKVAQLPGFRPGKAPLDLVRKNFSGKAKSKAVDELLQELVPQILKDKELAPVSSPVIQQFEEHADASISFSLQVEHSADFKVKGYSKIPAEKKVKTIADADIQKELAQLQERNAELVPSKADKLDKNLFASIDYSGSINGQAVADLKSENQLVDLSKPVIAESFVQGLLGMAKGEEKDIAVDFSADYAYKKIAGKSVVFKVKVQDIKEKQLPVLDDEFAKDFEFASLADLKSKIAESLKQAADRETEGDLEKQILDYLVKENSIPVPDSLVASQLESLVEEVMKNQYERALSALPKDKLEEIKKELKEKLRPEALRLVQVFYLLGGIAKQEKLQATDEDLKDQIEKTKSETSHPAEEIEKYFNDHKQSLLSQMTSKKVMQYLKDHAKIKEVPA